MPKPPYKDLETTIKKQAQENDALQKALQESEERYLNLFEHSGFSIVLINTKNMERVTFNKTEYESLGYTQDEFKKLSTEDIIAGDLEKSREHKNIIGDKGSHLFETRHRTKKGDIKHMLVSSVAVTINGELYHQNIASDITELKRVEHELKSARDELEEIVEKRTAELKRKTIELEESNTALKVLLQKRNDVIQDIEDRLLENTKQLVLPYVDSLRNSVLTERQMMNLAALEANLKDILSPFLKSLSKQYHSLTPTEIRIAALIREGKTSKEIIEILGISMKTIESHRDNLREKLGLKHKKINLQSYLRALDTP